MEEALRARVSRLHTTIDTSGDGKISLDEWRALSPDLATRREEFRNRLTNIPAAPAPASPSPTEPAARPAERPNPLLRRYDTNGDGKLDESEINAALEQFDNATLRVLAEHDNDNNGTLSPEELQAGLTALRGRGAPGGPGAPGEGERPQRPGRGAPGAAPGGGPGGAPTRPGIN
jgi:hypothetical protein